MQSSARAYRDWSQLSGTERGRHIVTLSRAIRERREEIAHLEVRDTGKVISEALIDIDSSKVTHILCTPGLFARLY